METSLSSPESTSIRELEEQIVIMKILAKARDLLVQKRILPLDFSGLTVKYISEDSTFTEYTIPPETEDTEHGKKFHTPNFFHEISHIIAQYLDPSTGERHLKIIKVNEFKKSQGLTHLDEGLASLIEFIIWNLPFYEHSQELKFGSPKDMFRKNIKAIMGKNYKYTESDGELWEASIKELALTALRDDSFRGFIKNIIQPGIDSFHNHINLEPASSISRKYVWSHSFELCEGPTGLTSADLKI